MARHSTGHGTGRRTLLAGGVGLLLGGGGLMAAAGKRVLEGAQGKIPLPSPATEPSPTGPPPPPPFTLASLDAATIVKLEAKGWFSWALLDHKDGAILGSATQSEVARTCSVIKVWIAADYLRRAAEKGTTPSSSKLASLSKMVRNSDNAVATSVFAELGKVASFNRLKELCQLTDFKPNNSWGQCQMSARDLARLGAAVTAGTAAGPKWTEWLLNEMRLVKLGTWGIREAFPAEQAATLAIKNGWDTTSATQTRHMNCMATTPRWTMITMTKYPIAMPDKHGQEIDKNVAAQLLQNEELKPLFAE